MIETLLPIAQRGLLFAGVLLLVGAAAWLRFVAPALRTAAHPERYLDRRRDQVARWGAWVSGGLMVVWGLRLAAQLLTFRDPFAPLAEDLRLLLFETFWGTVWIAQGVILAGLVLLFLRVRRFPRGAGEPEGGGRLLEGAVLGIVLTLALSSHAMSVPFNRPLAVAVDSAHTLAAGAWLGTLAVVMGGAGVRSAGPEKGSFLFAAELRAFSPVALVSVGILIFMGTLLAAVHLGELRSLWGSSYGRVLSLKVAAAGGVMALGYRNWRVGLPALGTAEGDRAVRKRAAMELLAAIVVLLLTAILTGTPMPEGVHQ